MRAANDVLIDALHADVIAWGTVDPPTLLSTSCDVFGSFHTEHPLSTDEAGRERRLFELEWQDTDVNTFADMRRRGRLAAGLRESIGPGLSSVGRYRDLLRPLGIGDELRLLCAADGSVWATVIVYRAAEHPAFAPADIAVAESASEPLAVAFRGTMLRAALDATGLVDPPGAVLVGADGSLLSTSFAAEQLLSTIDEQHVGTTLRNLAGRVEHSEHATVRIGGRGGVLLLHGSPAKGLDGATSVVVERPRRVELTPLIMEAIGLTDRERDLVERVLHGAGRGAIARTLGISEDTVGRHLTNAYRKANVGSKAELAAMLWGEFYESPRARHVSPSPYGYFL